MRSHTFPPNNIFKSPAFLPTRDLECPGGFCVLNCKALVTLENSVLPPFTLGVFPLSGYPVATFCFLLWVSQVWTSPVYELFVFSRHRAPFKPLCLEVTWSLRNLQSLIHSAKILGVAETSGKLYWIKCVVRFKTAFDCTFKIGNANWNSSWVP